MAVELSLVETILTGVGLDTAAAAGITAFANRQIKMRDLSANIRTV